MVAFIPHITALVANVRHSCIYYTCYIISCKSAPWLHLFHILLALVANVRNSCIYYTCYIISCKSAPWLHLFHILLALVANVRHSCIYYTCYIISCKSTPWLHLFHISLVAKVPHGCFYSLVANVLQQMVAFYSTYYLH